MTRILKRKWKNIRFWINN